MKRAALSLALSVLSVGIASAQAVPPPLINYQGVLRDASDKPLNGTYDMVYRFFSADVGGDEILVDGHTAVGASPVAVSGGLFNVQLGGGTVTDGSGPGTYASLADVFRDFSTVWLSIRVGSETLSPRIRIVAAAYALNAANLGGKPAGNYLDTSSAFQAKFGGLRVNTSNSYTIGVEASGTGSGAIFRQADGFTYAYIASGGYGIQATGWNGGGVFGDAYGNGFAYLGYRDYGIQASGSFAGGAFADADNSGGANVGFGDLGIYAWGNQAGGYFVAGSNPGSYAYAGNYDAGTNYKIRGGGAVSFVQNHPEEAGQVIVYAAPEGDEVAVYTRGTARLAGHEAHVALGETFRWVANPDIGLTAHLTPRGPTPGLYVASLSAKDMIVREMAGGSGDIAFDYIVYGLRLGFERMPNVQTKIDHSPVARPSGVDEYYAAHPDLPRTNALAKFEAMRAEAGVGIPVDLSRSQQLIAAINAYRPEVDGSLEKRLKPIEPSAGGPAAPVPPARRSPEPVPEARRAGSAADVPVAGLGTLGTATTDLFAATKFPLSGTAEAGDALVLDPDRPGYLRKAESAADPGVVGIASGSSAYGEEGRLETPVIGTGFALVKADAQYGAIRPGDLLVTSATPGHAMKAPQVLAGGTVIGKSLEPLESGTGLIKVLVMAR